MAREETNVSEIALDMASLAVAKTTLDLTFRVLCDVGGGGVHSKANQARIINFS